MPSRCLLVCFCSRRSPNNFTLQLSYIRRIHNHRRSSSYHAFAPLYHRLPFESNSHRGVFVSPISRRFSSGTGDVIQPDLVEADLNLICQHLNIAESDSSRQQLHLILLERYNLHLEGEPVPHRVSLRHWSLLLELPTPRERARFWQRLAQKEVQVTKRRDSLMRLIEQDQAKNRDRIQRETGIRYGNAGVNTYLCDTRRATVNFVRSMRIYQAMMFGPHVVLDMKYENEMKQYDIDGVTHQIIEAFGANRMSRYPFSLHMCNLRSDGGFLRALVRSNISVFDRKCPVLAHHKSHLKLFDRKNLVCLCSNASEELDELSEDDVYIIAAVPNRHQYLPLAMEFANRDRIRTVKLPTSKYIGGSNVHLSVDATLRVLLAVRSGAPWAEAFTTSLPDALTAEQIRRETASRTRRRQARRLSAERNWWQSAASRSLNSRFQ